MLMLLLLIIMMMMIMMIMMMTMTLPFQILAGNVTSAQLLRAFVQYKGTVSTAAQQTDLQSARRP